MANGLFSQLGNVPELLKNLLGKVRNIGGQRELLSPIPQDQVGNFIERRSGVVTPPVPTPAPPTPQYFQGGQLPGRAQSPATPESMQPIISNAINNNQLSTRPIENIDELLLSTLLSTESSFDPNAIGYMPVDVGAGQESAQGLGQILPSTARDFKDRRGLISGEFDPFSATSSAEVAAIILDQYIREAEGDVLRGLTRYKGSPTRAQEVLSLIGR